MRKVIVVLSLLVFISIPLFSGCQSKQLQEENAALKSQVDSLSAEKATLDSKVKDLATENSALKSQVEGLTKERDELTAKAADLEKQLAEAKTPKGKKK
jgi:septal ring factor EnvC (AmiA/AmiB activator)